MRILALAAALLAALAADVAHARADAAGPLDVFLAGPVDRPLASDPGSAAAQGIHIAHTEGRFGVPSFAFAETARFPARGRSPEEAARQHLLSLASLYRLAPASIETLRVAGVHDTGAGAVIASFAAVVDGVEVFRHEIDVVMNRDLELVAVSGYLPPSSLDVQGRFLLRHEDAVARAFGDLTGVDLAPQLLLPDESEGAYLRFDLPAAVESLLGWRLVVPARAKQVFFALPERLVAAYYVELNVDPATDGEAPYFSFVVDAASGALLFRNDLQAHSFTYLVHAHPDATPMDGPQGSDHSPHPTGNPDDLFVPEVQLRNHTTLRSYWYSRNDPWLPPGATETRGNNVDAYADLVAPDGYQVGFDRRATITEPDSFLAPWDPTLGPQANTSQIDAAITHLFYVTNFLHDWFYDAGFDERAGNAQMSNFGRGGLQGDALRAEAQDYAGRNNANMSTPADGASPRMQLFLFDGRPQLDVLAPASIAGAYVANSHSGNSVRNFDVTAPLAIPNPGGVELGCMALDPAQVAGKIVLLDRGSCNFDDKAMNAQNAGAVGVIIANSAPGDAPVLGGVGYNLQIPVISTTQAAGAVWKSAGSGVQVRIRGAVDRDGALDSALIAHEWGHMISNRLIGDANGLSNPQGRALGEGWGDFHALLLMVRQEDISRPANDNWAGAYAPAAWVANGGAGSAFYYGMRRAPYSTDMAKNAFLYEHVARGVELPGLPTGFSTTAYDNPKVHNAGEIWANMLWECYASLLQAHPFMEAQDRMKRYLVAAYKATPVMPTFLEARDALFAVAEASDPADAVRFRRAFAKRGAGLGAQAPERASMDFVGAKGSFAENSHLSVVEVRLDDSLTSCDKDGILDYGETGLLTFTVVNDGRTNLPGQTFSVSEVDTASPLFPPTVGMVPSLQPGRRATVAVPLQLQLLPSGTQVRLLVTFSEPSLGSDNRVHEVFVPVHHDFQTGAAMLDEMRGDRSGWTAQPGWSWRTEGDLAFAHGEDRPVAGDHALTTPWFAVRGDANFVLALQHRWSFETGDSNQYYDGGVVEFTLDGINWYDVWEELGLLPGYGGWLAEGGRNPLEGRAALVGTNPPFPDWTTTTLDFGRAFAGQSVKFRFRVGTDVAVGAWGWDIARVGVSSVGHPPFGAVVAESSDGTACNQPPVADPGRAQTVWEGGFNASGDFERTTVTLDGTGSFDPEGAPLAFAWRQVAGTPVVLSSPHAATTTFQPDVPRNETLAFELVVNDGTEPSLARYVDVTVWNVNRPPVAVATGPAVVAERSAATVTLDGTGSSDPDGEPLSFAWRQVGGSAVALTGATTATASFDLPEVAQDELFAFELVVGDGIDASEPARVEVLVENVDRAPSVSAGDDLVVASRAAVTLQATGSDPDGETLSWSWTQIAGPAVVLESVGASAGFVAPSVPVATDLVFRVTVEAGGVQASDEVTVTVLAEPAPFVDAGTDQQVAGRSVVVLRGVATVPGGEVPALRWTQLQGTPVVLSGDTSAVATFVAPDLDVAETLIFALEATHRGVSASDTVSVEVAADGLPVIDAGADRVVASREAVVLEAVASDPDGDALAFAWTQVEGPTVVLEAAASASPRFVAPSVLVDTELAFEVTVTANGRQASDAVRVTVQAEPVPAVDAGEDQAVAGRQQVVLAGSAAEGATVRWTQLEGPEVEIAGADRVVASFVAPDVKVETTLVFRLRAEAFGQVATDEVAVVVAADGAPVVSAGGVRDVEARSGVVLRGSVSDPEGDVAVVNWRQVAGPEVELEGADTLTPSFVAPDVREQVELRFELVAVANGVTSAADVAVVRVHPVNRRPVASGPNEIEEDERTLLTLEAEGFDADGDALTFAWVQTGGPAVELQGADTAAVSFVTPEVVEDARLSFRLVVRDAAGEASEPVVVTVLVRNVNRAPVASAVVVAGGAPGSTVVFDASGSSDEDGGALAFAWRQVEGTAVALEGADGPVARFVAPDAVAEAQVLVFEVEVRDADGATAVAQVSVEIPARKPEAKAKKSEEESGCSAAGGSPLGGLLAVAALALIRSRRRL